MKGISALSSQPFLLNTRSDNIKSIADLKDSDRIAVPAVKVSVQAVTLQMAAAKLFGAEEFRQARSAHRVDVAAGRRPSRCSPGSGEINNVFGVPPFQQQQLEKPGIRTILNSFDVMDGPHTFTVAWTSARFRDKNPVLYKALIAALKEATDIVDKDRAKAAGYWIEDVKSKLPLDKVTAVISGPQVKLDHDAASNHEVRDLHAQRRLAQGGAEIVEGPVLPRNPRSERELSHAQTCLIAALPRRSPARAFRRAGAIGRQISRTSRSASSCRSRRAARSTCSGGCSRSACRRTGAQTVIVENRPGAANMIGTQRSRPTDPDGYTLIIVVSTHATNPSLQSKVPYDGIKDFEPIALLARTPVVLYHAPVASRPRTSRS